MYFICRMRHMSHASYVASVKYRIFQMNVISLICFTCQMKIFLFTEVFFMVYVICWMRHMSHLSNVIYVNCFNCQMSKFSISPVILTEQKRQTPFEKRLTTDWMSQINRNIKNDFKIVLLLLGHPKLSERTENIVNWRERSVLQ